MKTEKLYSIEEIADYISGWAMGQFGEVEKIGKHVLFNSLSQLEDDQDGIEAQCWKGKRRGQSEQILDL